MWGDYISVLGDFPTWGNPHTGFTLLMAGLPLRHFPFVTCGIPCPCSAAFILAGGIAFLMAGLQRPKSCVAVLGDFPTWGNPHTGFTFLMAGLQRPKSRVAVLGDFPTWGNPHTGFTFLMAGLQRPKSRFAVLGDFPTWGNPHTGFTFLMAGLQRPKSRVAVLGATWGNPHTGGTPPSFVIGHVRDSPHRIPYLGDSCQCSRGKSPTGISYLVAGITQRRNLHGDWSGRNYACLYVILPSSRHLGYPHSGPGDVGLILFSTPKCCPTGRGHQYLVELEGR